MMINRNKKYVLTILSIINIIATFFPWVTYGDLFSVYTPGVDIKNLGDSIRGCGIVIICIVVIVIINTYKKKLPKKIVLSLFFAEILIALIELAYIIYLQRLNFGNIGLPEVQPALIIIIMNTIVQILIINMGMARRTSKRLMDD